MISYYRLRYKPVEVAQPLGSLLPRVSKSAIGSHLLENPVQSSTIHLVSNF